MNTQALFSAFLAYCAAREDSAKRCRNPQGAEFWRRLAGSVRKGLTMVQ